MFLRQGELPLEIAELLGLKRPRIHWNKQERSCHRDLLVCQLYRLHHRAEPVLRYEILKSVEKHHSPWVCLYEIRDGAMDLHEPRRFEAGDAARGICVLGDPHDGAIDTVQLLHP